jgi:hypothetical protein
MAKLMPVNDVASFGEDDKRCREIIAPKPRVMI